MNHSRTIIGITILAVLFCSVALGAEKTHPMPKSTWGGDHAIMLLTDKGAQLEFDCAAGEITEPLMVDANGDFDAHGTFAAEHPGPTTRDDDSGAAAHYGGHVEGDTMTLKIARGKDEVGTFTLTRGRQPILRKCR